MDWSLIYSTLTQLGPLLGFVVLAFIFFLWKDWRRELRLEERIEVLEKEQKEVILPLVERCASIIAQNTAAMTRLEKVISRMGFLQGHAEQTLLDRLVGGTPEDGNP